MSFIRPQPIDHEIILDETKIIMSKTDKKGIIEYANQYFMNICGYDEWELMGEPHNVIRHPDMPKIVFKLLWDRLDDGKNIHALVKNLAKDGSFYWVITNFVTQYNEKGEIIAYFSRRKKPPRYAIEAITPIYKKLIELEQEGGMDASGAFLVNFLTENNLTYDEFILQVLKITQEQLDYYFSDAY
jgi:PAS domain S-box-containing protein